MFRKKPADDESQGAATGQDGPDMEDAAPPLKPFSKRATHHHSPGKAPMAGSYRADQPRRAVDMPNPAARRIDRPRTGGIEEKKLIVGRGICLKGEITSCDKLVVEGEVEASLNDARIIDVSRAGFFKGNAEVDDADISGRYEGELIARDTLTVRSSGRVSGSVRYGRIVIESGGEISGDMQTLDKPEEEAPADTPPAEDDFQGGET